MNIPADGEGTELSLAGSSRRWPPPGEGLILLSPATLALWHPPPSTSLEWRQRKADSQARL